MRNNWSIFLSCCIIVIFLYNKIKTTEPKTDDKPDLDPLNLFVGSAHIVDFEVNNTNTIILNSMAEDTNTGIERTQTTIPLYCLSDKNEKVKPHFYLTDGGQGCSWKNYFVECQFQKVVNSLKLVDNDGYGPEIPLRRPIERKIPLVACLSRSFYFDNWQVLFTALEMYNVMGVSEFSMNIMSINDNIYKVLQLYQQALNLTINPGIVMPMINGKDPNKNSDVMNQIMNNNECLFDYREAAEFLFFVDIDDLIVSDNGNLLDKARELRIRYPYAAGYEFFWKTSEYIHFPSPPLFSIKNMFDGLVVLAPHHSGKSIVVPKRIDRSKLHYVRAMKFKEKPVKSIILPMTEGFTVHFRYEKNIQSTITKLNPGSAADSKGALHYLRNTTVKLLQNIKAARYDNVESQHSVSTSSIQAAHNNFQNRLNDASFYSLVQQLPSELYFVEQFKSCLKKVPPSTIEKPTCASMKYCDIKVNDKVKCTQVKIKYSGYAYRHINVFLATESELVQNMDCNLKVPYVDYVSRVATVLKKHMQ
ncbi:unnamed protein product [Bursaphelenchus okinawaensis]|uniref:Glycosyltransferase family 92 protein n=1 Tax=Bursaphelenchus okinawaensis TaxID=465554 RepID=A0A811KD52_9BILA|nr:unnamed protein product [Bursaphelenchus okinawaensis]CAG9101341.1 unnamed protein product [Bursaphelenchus okinawaensis]